jgi:hypothetical protein
VAAATVSMNCTGSSRRERGEKVSIACARKRSAAISLAIFFSMRGRSTLMATTP